MRYWKTAVGLLAVVVLGLGGFTGMAQADAPAKPVVVPFEMLQSNHILIQIKVNGKGPYPVIFDTGAPVILLNNKIAKAAGLFGKSAQAPLFTLFGSRGQVRVKELEIGDLKVNNVPAIVMDHPTVEVISKMLRPIEGIVGFPFFARYTMTIDYKAKELTFVPNGFDPPDIMEALTMAIATLAEDNPKPKVLAPAAQWGLRLSKDDDDQEAGTTIQEVRPGSAAEKAGLRPGDRLLTLDGRWTDSVSDAYQAAGHVKPGTTARVTIRRGSKEMELTVTPRAGF
jgi:hypothetical protein